MRKRIFAALLVLALLPATACSPGADTEKGLGSVSDSLGIDASGGTVVTGTNSHGGFHGDGLTFVEIDYEDDRVLSQIEQNPDWRRLPLSENVEALVHGVTSEEDGVATSIGPYLIEDGEAVFPQVDNGYYYFCDRHSQSTDPSDDSEVLNRASFNVTVAVYDIDSQKLYYCELDT